MTQYRRLDDQGHCVAELSPAAGLFGKATTVLLLAVLAYCLSYIAMSRPQRRIIGNHETLNESVLPRYVWGSLAREAEPRHLWQMIFEPARMLDIAIRPDFWKGSYHYLNDDLLSDGPFSTPDDEP
ncbi:MAG: hypothetical protein EXS05_04200 [Planctomycetaceae bacterium]|nr:hypothetical protein [Planctomycetaceae bacterium]